ncbi:MAG: FAD-dependent oxidoreductase, partial [Alphaproteobacteria bacterium]
KFDVAIIGAGVAGITLALALSRTKSVLLLEGGDTDYTSDSQDLYIGETSGRDYFELDQCRMRFFGGTSNIWSGWCQTLEPMDFVRRDHIPHSGWPIGYKDIAPYFKRATDILDIDTETGVEAPYRTEFDAALVSPNGLKSHKFLWSGPTRFGEKYHDAIAGSDSIICLTNANLTDITLTDDLNAVSSLTISGFDGQTRRFSARRVVLAAGGLENPRILLNCNSQIAAGVGNQNDLVGRFFAEHPHHFVGQMVFEDALRERITSALTYAEMTEKPHYYLFYGASEGFIEEHKVLNFGLRVLPDIKPADGTFPDRLKRAVCAPDWLSKGVDLLRFRKYPYCAEGHLHVTTDQAPNPDSRVQLSEKVDAFGMRRIDLDWRMSALDRRTIAAAATHIGAQFARRNLGRIKVTPWVYSENTPFPGPGEDEVAGNHHMGTTRMADDAKQGVVDKNAKVHGISNLYVAGSSIFPTYGQVNPTLPLTQLTLRLADHLNGLS